MTNDNAYPNSQGRSIAEQQNEAHGIGKEMTNTQWKLVPVEPTIEMRDAMSSVSRLMFSETRSVYKAMLAAAPQPAALEPVGRVVDDGTACGTIEWMVCSHAALRAGDPLYALPPAAAAIIAEERARADEAEKKMQQGWMQVCETPISFLSEENTKLRAELAEAQKDAKRYRYFKESFDHPMERRALAATLGCKFDEFDPCIDAAIDAAMRGKEGVE